MGKWSHPNNPAGSLGWVIAAVAILWGHLLYQLHFEWVVHPQYSYGWWVAPLALYLFWKRWEDRPIPKPETPTLRHLYFLSALACALLPYRIIQEANPDWRAVSWAGTVIVVTITLGLVWFSGGRPWLKHFMIPIGFVLLAVPWPTDLEKATVLGLMRVVSAVTVEALNWTGTPAWQRGNVIELSTGLVGVSEACSGVRSFQATLMVSILLGELYRLRSGARLCLVIAGASVAILFNLVRTFGLTWMTARYGLEYLERWHDPAGHIILLGSVAVLWVIALRIRKGKDSVRTIGMPLESRFQGENASLNAVYGARVAPRVLAVSCIAWLAAGELITAAWFAPTARAASMPLSWSLQMPTAAEGALPREIGDEIRGILRYDQGQSVAWNRTDGTQWTIFFFRWEPGRTAAQRARGHSPDVCLPAAGLRLVHENASEPIQIGRLKLPVREYRFEHHGQPLYVFYSFWESGAPADPEVVETELTVRSRLRAAWEGKRHQGQQLLEVAVAGAPNAADAKREFVSFCRTHIQFQEEVARVYQ